MVNEGDRARLPDGPPGAVDAGLTRGLTAGGTLARSAVWNLLGQAATVLVAVLAVPHLVRGLGLERFGVLTLAWTVVGYFSLFDLGLGWALTRIVSEKLSAGSEHEVPELVWTSLVLLLLFGTVGAGVVALLAPLLVGTVLHVPKPLAPETLQALYILAFSIPLVTGSAGLAGVLAAQQRFGLSNAVRVPLAALSYLGPLAVLPYSKSLVPVVTVLVASRLVGWAVSLGLCLRVMPALRHGVRFRRSLVGPLLGYGGWITVTNLVGPLMVYLDRFLVGSLLTLAAVAYYATPYDLASRMWMVSSPAVAVLFPAFAATFSLDPDRTRRLFTHGVRYAFCVLFPCALVLSTLAPEGLRLWLGPEFESQSTRVLQLLAIGVFINGLAHMALALVQGVGRASWTARLHMIELPLYLVMAWWLIRARGIEGAAMAWVVRVVIDALTLFLMAGSLLKVPITVVRSAAIATTAALAVLAVGALLPSSPSRIGFVGVVLVGHALVAWRMVVVPARETLAATAASRERVR